MISGRSHRKGKWGARSPCFCYALAPFIVLVVVVSAPAVCLLLKLAVFTQPLRRSFVNHLSCLLLECQVRMPGTNRVFTHKLPDKTMFSALKMCDFTGYHCARETLPE